MRLPGKMALCSLILTATFGCVGTTTQSEKIDVVTNPELVKNCMLKREAEYTAIAEKNALTIAKNKTAEHGGNVFLLVDVDKSSTLTTTVHGKIYACEQKP